jgi:hypothetical protein
MLMEIHPTIIEPQKSDVKFKDTFFRTLFHEKERALELCNAVTNSNFTLDDDLRIFSLGDKSIKRRNNDLAILINDQLLALKEHQGIVNANMPLRFLPYVSDILYTWITDKRALYKSKLITIPTPKFYVLYNGKAKLEYDVLRLSDAFRYHDHTFSLELEVKVIDVNYESNHDVLSKSPSLNGYAYLINQIQIHQSNNITRDKAILLAVKHCIDKGVLSNFLEKHYKEVSDMLAWEITLEDEYEIRKEEVLLEAAAKFIRKGLTLQYVADVLELTEYQISELKDDLSLA